MFSIQALQPKQQMYHAILAQSFDTFFSMALATNEGTLSRTQRISTLIKHNSFKFELTLFVSLAYVKTYRIEFTSKTLKYTETTNKPTAEQAKYLRMVNIQSLEDTDTLLGFIRKERIPYALNEYDNTAKTTGKVRIMDSQLKAFYQLVQSDIQNLVYLTYNRTTERVFGHR